MHVMHLNILKARDNGFVADLKPGDKVRVDDTAMFKKGTESRWSDEVHVVQSASGKTVTLADGTTHRRNKVLSVPHNTVIAPVAEKNGLGRGLPLQRPTEASSADRRDERRGRDKSH
jgi:hypothetical protein